MARVIISAPLKRYTQNTSSCEVNGTTVGEILHKLGERFPELKCRLVKKDGTVDSSLLVLVDDNNSRFLANENTSINVMSEIRIIKAMSGG